MIDEQKLKEALEWTDSFKESFKSDGWGHGSLSTLCKLAEEYLKSSEKAPVVEKAHPYGIENADRKELERKLDGLEEIMTKEYDRYYFSSCARVGGYDAKECINTLATVTRNLILEGK